MIAPDDELRRDAESVGFDIDRLILGIRPYGIHSLHQQERQRWKVSESGMKFCYDCLVVIGIISELERRASLPQDSDTIP